MDLPIAKFGALNGTTAVTVLDAPSTGQRVVPMNGISIYNPDTVTHTYTLQRNKASVLTVIQKLIVLPGTTDVFFKFITLVANDETLEVFYEAGHTTTESSFDTSALETS